jgi:hypothetical protein
MPISKDFWSRREVLQAGIALGVLAVPAVRAFADAKSVPLPQKAVDALGASAYVYISPLKSDGEESRCHAEVWFAFDDGAVLIATSSEGWKARALGKGLVETRLWVGDHGRVSSDGEKFRAGPSFDAKSSRDTDPAVFERLLASFGKKYPDEWDKWEPRFRKGYTDGSRVVIRYTPV